MKITSVNNELVKEVTKLQQRKYRDESELFLLEGDKCIEEAIASGVIIEHIFVNSDYEKFNNYKNKIEVTEAILSKISTTTTPPKAIAVGKQIKKEWNNEFTKVLLLEAIKDAGNLGTILRTACAFDIDAVILFGDTVDLYNPKCVRASVGNLWKVPVFNIKNINELTKICKNFTPIATLPKAENTIWLKEFKTPEKALVMFGTEASGLSNELITLSKTSGTSVTIEMSERVESLNLSMSVGIILYKLFV